MTEPGDAHARNPVAAAVAVAAVVAALVAAWAMPALAVPFVWPLLFVVPGWGLVSLVRPPIGATGRLGLAIVLSVAVSAHLVHWLAVATGGYRRETVFVAALLLAAPLPIAVWRGGARRLVHEARSAARALRRDAVAFAFAAMAAGFVGLVLDSGLWKQVAGGISAGGSNWSDLGVHLSISQSLNAGNFPPQVPYFAGEPLVYHWFADFHAAIAARAADIFSVPSFVVSSAILAGALALVVHGLARKLLRGPRARRAALLAATLVVIGGGLGWVRLVGDLASGLGDPVTLVTEHSYDNQWLTEWPYFRIPSVMGTGLLVHRATTAGLPMLVGAALLLVAGLPSAGARAAGARDRPAVIAMAGLLGALMAPFHFFFFPAFGALALAWVIAGRRLLDAGAPRNAALLLAPYLLSLPFAVTPFLQAGASGDLRLVLGWESAPMADGPAAVLFFYATNLGAPFLLALAALIVPGVPRRAFLAAWVLILFAVPNLVQVSIVAFDMNKYFQAMWIAVAVLAAWLIRRWPAPAVAAVLLVSVPSPLLVSAWTGLNREVVLGWDEAEAWRWIAGNTPERSVFVTNGWLNSPTDAAGRLRLMTYSVYVANLGYSPDGRVAQIDEIYCSGDADRAAEIAATLGAGYLLDTGPPRGCAPRTDFGTGERWTLVFDTDHADVWQLDRPAAGASVSFGP